MFMATLDVSKCFHCVGAVVASLQNATPSEEFSGVQGQTTPENHCSNNL